MMKPRREGFTLIEMLTVLVIVGIMVALALPAVTSLMKSGGVSAASRHVSNMLGLARQLAITQRTYARVVFPYSDTTIQPDKWYRTYAVMTNRNTTVANGWGYVTKWEYLPVGVIFTNGPTAGSLNSPTSLKREDLPFPATGSVPLRTLAFIEFSPTGAATPPSGSSDSVLAITEGFVTVVGTPTPTAKALANVTAVNVNSIVGRIQVTRP